MEEERKKKKEKNYKIFGFTLIIYPDKNVVQ